MMRSIGWGRGLFVVVAVSACGGTVINKEGSGAEGSGGSGTDAGSVGVGGAIGGHAWGGSGGYPYSVDGGSPNWGGSGGSGNVGGGYVGRDAGLAAYTCSQRAPADPGGSRQLGTYCADLPAGSEGTCVTAGQAAVDPLAKILGHAECAPSLVCAPAPSSLGGTDGGYAAPSHTWCTTTMGLGVSRVGGCVMRPFTAGYPLASLLSRETCGEVEVCVPCDDPVSHQWTGACSNLVGAPNPSCTWDDAGACGGVNTPLPHCGVFDGGPSSGVCIPASAPSTLRPNSAPVYYKQDDCAAPGTVCVPARIVEDPGSCAQRCTTTLASFGDQYGPGACVPSFIVRDMNPTGLSILTRGTCSDPNDLCAPCLDPLNAGAPTGVCD